MTAYWHYLAEAAVSISLISKKEIQDDLGLIFPVGCEVCSDFLEVCQEQFDSAEIELIVGLEAPYSSDELLKDLRSLLHQFPALKPLYKPEDHNHIMKLGAELVDRMPLVAFRLKILKVCLPFEFSRTAFTLWFVIFESEFSAREEADFIDLFLTALAHDLGLLDVNPKFTRQDHDPRSSKDDVNGYYNHVNFSARFIERHSGVSRCVIKSITQHHEIMDGTGYPKGVSGNVLSEYGQHIHLYDTLFSIYTKQFQPLNKTFADISPVIEINAVTHFGQVATRLVALLSTVPKSSQVFFGASKVAKVKIETEQMALFIEASMSVIQEFTSEVGFRHEDRVLFCLQNSFIHIALAYYKLRIMHKQAVLADVFSDEDEAHRVNKALEESFLMLREIIFHINKFQYRLRLYVSQNVDCEISDFARLAIEKLCALNLKLIK